MFQVGLFEVQLRINSLDHETGTETAGLDSGTTFNLVTAQLKVLQPLAHTERSVAAATSTKKGGGLGR